MEQDTDSIPGLEYSIKMFEKAVAELTSESQTLRDALSKKEEALEAYTECLRMAKSDLAELLAIKAKEESNGTGSETSERG